MNIVMGELVSFVARPPLPFLSASLGSSCQRDVDDYLELAPSAINCASQLGLGIAHARFLLTATSGRFPKALCQNFKRQSQWNLTDCVLEAVAVWAGPSR